jgi:hypothetical protein
MSKNAKRQSKLVSQSVLAQQATLLGMGYHKKFSKSPSRCYFIAELDNRRKNSFKAFI